MIAQSQRKVVMPGMKSRMFARYLHETQNLHMNSDRPIRLCIPQKSRGHAYVDRKGVEAKRRCSMYLYTREAYA